MSAFNAENTILTAVVSALDQSYERKEIVVVDDASTDSTYCKLKSIASCHHSIRLFRNPSNKGVAATRNAIIERANGEFIAFFDDDDISDSQRVVKQISRLREARAQIGHSYIFCYTARQQLLANGQVYYEKTMATEKETIPSSDALLERILLGRVSQGVTGSCATCSQLGPISLFRELGGFDERLRRGEDTELNIRLAISGGTVAGVAEPLVTQQITGGPDKLVSAEQDGYEYIIRKHYNYLSAKGWGDFFRFWPAIRHAQLKRRRAEMIYRLLVVAFHHPFQTLLKLYWSSSAAGTRRIQTESRKQFDSKLSTAAT